jgi:hypothetical protein
MKNETLAFTNRSGSTITLRFDATNVVEVADGVGIRIPASIERPSGENGTCVFTIQAPKSVYPTVAQFLEQVEKVGKLEVVDWLKGSPDELIYQRPKIDTAWTIGKEARPDSND